MKVLTWNIGCGAAGYHAQNIAAIAQWIRANDIDIALLQEVDRFALRTHMADIPAFLAQQTGYHAFFKPSFTLPPEGEGHPPREYGNCILARAPFTSTHHIPLPAILEADTHPWETETRSGLCVQLQTNDGTPLYAATAHFACSPDFLPSRVRQQQAELLVNALQTIVPQGAPFILGADLNVPATSSDLHSLTAYATLQTATLRPTWPLGGPFGTSPIAALDHLYTRNLPTPTITKHDEPTLTDHSAIIAEFTT
jgi:endonuclease/exonuclease/phosphatase family metal-dependent hydrolase